MNLTSKQKHIQNIDNQLQISNTPIQDNVQPYRLDLRTVGSGQQSFVLSVQGPQHVVHLRVLHNNGRGWGGNSAIMCFLYNLFMISFSRPRIVISLFVIPCCQTHHQLKKMLFILTLSKSLIYDFFAFVFLFIVEIKFSIPKYLKHNFYLCS